MTISRRKARAAFSYGAGDGVGVGGASAAPHMEHPPQKAPSPDDSLQAVGMYIAHQLAHASAGGEAGIGGGGEAVLHDSQAAQAAQEQMSSPRALYASQVLSQARSSATLG